MKLVPILESGKPFESIDILPPNVLEVCQFAAESYKKSTFVEPWIGYLAYEGRECIGTCAFKTPPSNNRVEIAYFTFPESEGRGFATQMAAELVNIARDKEPGIIVFAQTLPETNASTSILHKLEFSLLGDVQHPEDGRVWEWELPAPTIDISLVEHCLTLSPEERIESHEAARLLVEDLEMAGQQYYAKKPQASS